MQTLTDSDIRRVLLQTSTAEDALVENSAETGGEEIVRHGSAVFGLRLAVPLALVLWGVIAALIWAARA